MLMRLIVGACIFTLGYYIGRETALNDPDAKLSARKSDYLKGDFTDVEPEPEVPNDEQT